jgi:hypothetical protein
MLKTHNPLVLSRIEYGSELYSAPSKSILKTLDSLHYYGIREALGAFCTSPRESLLAEAAVPDLNIRRNTRSLRNGEGESSAKLMDPCSLVERCNQNKYDTYPEEKVRNKSTENIDRWLCHC